MKITFITPHIKIAGGIRAILTYASRLAQRGHDVDVLVPEPRTFIRWFRNIFMRTPGWFPNFAARIRWIPSYESRYIPVGDAIIATAWQTASMVAGARPESGRKFYFIQAYESFFKTQTDRAEATYRLPLRHIVISSWLKGLLREKFGTSAEILVTPVDTKLFHFVPTVRMSEPIRVLVLDHHAQLKGLAAAHAAVQVARAAGARFKVVMFGTRKTEAAVWADEYILNPPQNKLAELYSACHIYLCPSWFEGLGMPPMEAMACKNMLVTYDTGGCRDYAFNDKTALVTQMRNHVAVAAAQAVPENERSALAQALVRAVNDIALRERISATGYEFITTHFSWERAIEQMENILHHD